MEKGMWNKLIIDLFTFYRFDKLPSAGQTEAWYERVKYIPDSSIKRLLDAFTNEHDNLPRNLPKAIKAIYAALPSDQRMAAYDPLEDFFYPLNLMWAAFRVLDEKGLAAFRKYAAAVSMPINDRQRVIGKYEAITGDWKPNRWQKLASMVGKHLPSQRRLHEIAPLREPGEEREDYA